MPTQDGDVQLITELPVHHKPLGEPDPEADAVLEKILRRIAPKDGRRVVLVAASFNSAI